MNSARFPLILVIVLVNVGYLHADPMSIEDDPGVQMDQNELREQGMYYESDPGVQMLVPGQRPDVREQGNIQETCGYLEIAYCALYDALKYCDEETGKQACSACGYELCSGDQVTEGPLKDVVDIMCGIFWCTPQEGHTSQTKYTSTWGMETGPVVVVEYRTTTPKLVPTQGVNRENEKEQVNERCYRADKGGTYIGKEKTTEDGRRCANWGRKYVQKTAHNGDYWAGKIEKYEGAFPNHNYCRNPIGDGAVKRPWCFVKKGSTNWGYCKVPMC